MSYKTKLFYDEWTCAFSAVCAIYPASNGNVVKWCDHNEREYIELWCEHGYARFNTIDEILTAQEWTFEQMEAIAMQRNQ